jgi:hypothetical protein
MIDVHRPESLWCQTGIIFIVRQETLLFGGYMQRGVEIGHGWGERPKFKLVRRVYLAIT